MAGLPDRALKKLRIVNLKESIAYLFLSKGDIRLCSLFSCYYHVFKLKVIYIENTYCVTYLWQSFPATTFLPQFLYNVELLTATEWSSKMMYWKDIDIIMET